MKKSSPSILEVSFGKTTVEYELFENDFIDRWMMVLQNSLDINNGRVPNEGHFFGSALFSEPDLRQKMLDCINKVNSYIPGSIQNFPYENTNHPDLMKIHVDFERLEPLKEYRFPTAPIEVARALTDLNIYIHQYEGLSLLPLDHIDLNPNPVLRYAFKDEDYKLFETTQRKGYVYLSYGVTGVPPMYAYFLNHNEKCVSQDNYTAGMQFYFTLNDPQFDRRDLERWFREKWNIDATDPKIALGYIPLGKMRNIEAADQAIENILLDPKIVGMKLSPKPDMSDFTQKVIPFDDSTPRLVHSPKPESKVQEVEPQWPQGRELFRHLEYKPWLMLPFEFDHKACLKEATNLLNKFVTHRPYDQESASKTTAQWKSLGIYAVGGDSTKTQNHTDYGITEPRYELSEIAAHCPETLKFLNQLTDLKQCQRVRFMLLEPGAKIKVHSDAADLDTTIAINVALNMPERCDFWTDLNSDGSHSIFSHKIPIKDGSVFVFNNAPYHMVENNSNENRIHIIIHGPIRFNSEQLLHVAREQNKLFNEKALMNQLMFKKSYRKKRDQINPNDLVDWVNLGVDGSFFHEKVQIAVLEDEGVSPDLMQEAMDLITYASLFPLKAPAVKMNLVSDWLKQQVDTGKKFAVLIGAGTYVKDMVNFYLEIPRAIRELQDAGAALMGHIINRPKNYEDGLTLPFLHEQFAIIDLEKWSHLDAPTLDVPYNGKPISFPNYTASTENVHDDYTPLWLASGTTSHEARKGRSGWCTEFIAQSIKNGLRVINVPLTLRATKKFSYPRAGRDYQYKEIKSDISHFLNNVLDKVFVFNNEPLNIVSVPNLKPNCFISVAAGFKPFAILKQYFGPTAPRKIIFADYSLRTLEHFKKVVHCNSFHELISVLSAEFDFQKTGGADSRTKAETMLKEVLAESFSNNFAELLIYMRIARSAQFVHTNLIGQPEDILSRVTSDDRIVLWHSNAWDSNAALFNWSARDLQMNHTNLGSLFAKKMGLKCWKREERFELILGADLSQPTILITDGSHNVFDKFHYTLITDATQSASEYSSWNFKHELKLYCFIKEKRISLSLLGSPQHVFTYYIPQNNFDTIISKYDSSEGINVEPFFIHKKGDYIRFSHHSGNGLETNIRISAKKWASLINDYKNKIQTSDTAYITCVVD